MRRALALLAVLVLLTAGCNPPPVVVPTAAPSLPVQAAETPDGTPVAQITAAATEGPTADAAGASAGASPASPLPTGAAVDDKTAPSVSLIVDPPQIDWTSQATVTARAADPAGIKTIEVLLGDQVLGTGEGEELQIAFIPGAIDGLQGGTTYTLLARATDVAGNVAVTSAPIQVGPAPTDTPQAGARGAAVETATRLPAAAKGTPTAGETPVGEDQPPAATAAPVGGAVATDVIAPGQHASTTYRVTEMQLPTYPYAPYLTKTTDGERVDYPVYTLDRGAYEGTGPKPQMKTYRLLVLENRYLRLGILPDLGGRIYECIFKPTGANEFYANPVVKPTQWGPPSPSYPAGANWWLATGGLEWGFPVEEHGYEFGTVWGFDHAAQPDGGVMITVYTQTGPEKPYAVVDIILPPDTAYFVLRPRIVNPLAGSFRFKFWANAMLAPGKANSIAPDARLLFPADRVVVHSAGDSSLPPAGQRAQWPVMAGRDLSRLGNWPGYLGVFAAPATAGFAGVYDPAADEGIVRVFPKDVAKGVKLFAPAGLDPALWTDDGSTYVELHGGLTPTFDDWYELGPGEEVEWSEFWYPVARIGGVTFANDRAALALTPTGSGVRLGLFPTLAVNGQLTVKVGGAAQSFDVHVSPEQPFVQEFAGRGPVAVSLVSAGETVVEWTGAVPAK